MGAPRCAPLLLLLLLPLLLTPPAGDAAVITGACDKDSQCGGGMCCAVSIWVKSIRICTPMGQVGDSCHPLTRKHPECCCYRTEPPNQTRVLTELKTLYLWGQVVFLSLLVLELWKAYTLRKHTEGAPLENSVVVAVVCDYLRGRIPVTLTLTTDSVLDVVAHLPEATGQKSSE
ncbi:hypothetical protein STEG23_030009 [Scotinomys teguina]